MQYRKDHPNLLARYMRQVKIAKRSTKDVTEKELSDALDPIEFSSVD